MRLAQFIETYQDAITQAVLRTYPPVYTARNRDEWGFDLRRLRPRPHCSSAPVAATSPSDFPAFIQQLRSAGVTTAMLVAFGENGIKTVEDLHEAMATAAPGLSQPACASGTSACTQTVESPLMRNKGVPAITVEPSRTASSRRWSVLFSP